MARHALFNHEEFKQDIQADFTAGLSAIDDLEAKILAVQDSIEHLRLAAAS